MNQKIKRITAVLLAIVLAFSIPMAAYAEESETELPVEISVESTEVSEAADPEETADAEEEANLLTDAPMLLAAAPAEDAGTKSFSVTKNGVTFTVTWPKNIACGEEITFSFSCTGAEECKYRLYSLTAWDGSEHVSVYDVSYGTNSAYKTDDSWKFTFYASGTYYVRFSAFCKVNGTYTTLSTGLYDIPLTIEDSNYPNLETIVSRVANECLQAGCTTDFEKAVYMNDWLIDNCVYDSSYSYCSAEGALARGTGTCEAYHRAYVMLLNAVGVETGRIEGNGHVWTAVKMDGNWYQIDTTWNDPGYVSLTMDLQHFYFGLNDALTTVAHSDHVARAGYESNHLENNYYIKTGTIHTWSDPIAETIQTAMDRDETNCVVTITNNAYANILYVLVAYQLSTQSYTYRGKTVSVSAEFVSTGYDGGTLSASWSEPLPDAPVVANPSNAIEGVKLSWSPVTGAEKYRVYRNDGNADFVFLAETTSTSYVDTTAVSGVTYRYSVCSLRSDGVESSFDEIGVTIRRIEAPVVSVSSTTGGVKVSWTACGGVETYRVYRKLPGGSYAALTTTTALSYTDASAESGIEYIYTVRCVNSSGATFGAYNKTGKTITYYAAPVVSVSSTTEGVKISWTAPGGVNQYRVYRKLPDGSYQKIGETSSLTFTDTTAQSGVQYVYTVRNLSSSGTTFGAYNKTGKTITYYAAPVVSVSNTTKGVKVSWTASGGVKQYRVFRKLPGGSYQKICDTTALTYTDTTAESGTQYVYTVRCLSTAGSSYGPYYKNGVTITYIAAPKLKSVSMTIDGVVISWSSSVGAEKYRVFRKTSGSGWQKIADTTMLSYTDTTAVSGTDYVYTVRCLDDKGKSYISAYDSKGLSIAYIAAPALVSAAKVSGGIKITWKASAGAEKYRVFRKTEGGSWTKIADTTSLSYTDKTGVAGTTYIYTVRCTNSAGTAYTSSYDSKGKTVTR